MWQPGGSLWYHPVYVQMWQAMLYDLQDLDVACLHLAT
jgi:hypothetical protein